MQRLLAVWILTPLLACAATPPQAVAPTVGVIDGTHYSHAALGVEVELPPGWLFYPPAQLHALLSESPDSGLAANPIVPLFGMYSVAGANPAFANNVIGIVETVSPDVVGLTSMTYAISLRKNLNVEAGFEAARLEPVQLELGGQSVAAVTSFTADEGTEYNQTFYAHVVDQVVVLIIGTESAAVPSDLDTAIEAIRLHK